VTCLDLHSGFVDASGLQIPELFNDGLHPTEAGYAIWRDRLIALLNAKRPAGKAR
jgi:lysophospholipase L1-like esterase